MLRRLASDGLNATTEEHLLRMKDIILKLQRHKIALEPAKERLLWNEQGVIHLGAILPPVQTRSVDLHSTELLMKTMVWSGNINVPLSAILIDQKNYLSGDHASAAFVQMNPVNILLNIFHLNDLKSLTSGMAAHVWSTTAPIQLARHAEERV